MSAPDKLRLHEEVLLLSLRDEAGTTEGGMYHLAIGGAVLSELLLAGRFAMWGEGKKRKVVVASTRYIEDEVLNDCLELVAADKKQREAKHWVMKFGQLKDLKHRVARPLCDRGILREEEAKILLLFNQKRYPEADPRPERKLIQRLERAIFSDTRDLDARTVALISLADKTGILKNAFRTKEDRRRLKGRKDRIAEISAGHIVGDGAKEAVAAVQAAVMVAVIIPTVTG